MAFNIQCERSIFYGSWLELLEFEFHFARGLWEMMVSRREIIYMQLLSSCSV